jgi:predicted transposase YdaD
MGKHDTAYKQFFSHPATVKSFLLDFIEEDWVKDLDYSSLERYPSDSITEGFEERYGDMIWTLNYGNQKLYICILLEFQSTVDAFMSVRVQTYSMLFYQNLIKKRLEELEEARKKQKEEKKNNKTKKKWKTLRLDTSLPRILPIVLYNGKRPWKAALNVKDLIQKGPTELDKYLPSMTYFLFNLHGIADETFESKKGFSTYLFQIEKEREDLKIVDKLIKKLVNHPEIPQGEEFKKIVRHWFKSLIEAGPDFEGKEELLENIDHLLTYEEVQDMWANTINKHWAAEWITKGEERGEERGIEKGKEELAREIIFNMLEKQKTIAEIADLTNLTEQQIQKIIATTTN